MSSTRRQFLLLGGATVVASSLPAQVLAADAVDILMLGSPRGERVWFTPVGVAVPPGTRIRFTNQDPINSHTATAYHPHNFNRPRRIPQGAEAFDSGYLLPGQSFEIVLEVPGVYDYYCLPHERAGMAGRIVVGGPDLPNWQGVAENEDGIAAAALASLPAIERILELGEVKPEEMR